MRIEKILKLQYFNFKIKFLDHKKGQVVLKMTFSYKIEVYYVSPELNTNRSRIVL